ncbi:MAG: Topoisomerase DNA-binding C4 zinc finger domain protein [Candidatus Woesebacteria bacterium GW2011_GWA1_41_7]|uniref:Topoisomerase DNA-binding C4 zinc finger domain protein n=1 Tax=Candidatus Woesebacteria bacterium GW2011_GWA1_41_7 TaxID=1618556 RepID=A0A0G0WXA6_9BACT|nr:MAG: Topoisomerase DNA-binding C4 zinc finger domain protein [Candidatus Woesebacteria bacterium GW2011_GWA1_41_7]
MGDMADYALDNAMNDWEEYQSWVDNGRNLHEGYEKGIIDELGYENTDTRMPDPTRRYSQTIKPHGEGPCPLCGKDTILTEGKYGKFYGCCNFPTCKGSRNY